MTAEKIYVKFLSKPILGIAPAIPVIRRMVIEVDNPDEHGAVGAKDGDMQQLYDLGIKPGMRFFIIKSESMSSLKNCYTYRSRNNWDAIWSRKRLKDHQKNNPNCEACEHSFGHKHYKKYHFKSCRDCKHGLNIVASFIINEDYRAYFGPAIQT